MSTVTVNGNTYSSAGESANDMRSGGHRTHLLPMLADAVVDLAAKVTAAQLAETNAETAETNAEAVLVDAGFIAVAGDLTGADTIGTVAGISANVTTVAGVAANVTTVAGVAADVTTVAGIAADVAAIENIAANVTTVAGISANITIVAGVSADVTTVAGVASDVSAVAAQFIGWNFSTTTTMADPGSGIMRFNNATLASVTAIALDDNNSAAADVSAYVLTWDDSSSTIKGTITVRQGTANFAMYDVTGLTDNAGWTQVAVTYVASSGTFSGAVLTFVDFDRSGDAGTGNMNGPGSSTADSLARFDGTSGTLLKNGAVIGTDVMAFAAAASQAEMETGAEAALRTMSPLRVSQAIAALGGGDEIITPTNTSPADAATNQTETPTLTGSTFYSNYGATHSNTQVQVHTTSDFTTPQYSSGDQAGSVSFTLPSGQLVVSTTYYWRMRYKNSRGTYSDWSAPFSFQTASLFNSYISTPTATPGAFGDALDGGFYSGMIWNQIAQAADSKALATGTQAFTVADMTSTPIVYEGQALEVRSRANPANNFVGTVTGATGTTLTLNVSSIGGSGTFSDWSVMAKFRLVVAPKSSGENAAIAIKNANSALPTACQTLAEGWASTEAMKNADTSTVYPAAHWARALTINSKSDWYIPARDELELCWRNLKPTTDNNYATADRSTAASFDYKNNGSYGDTAATHGLDNNSSPTGAAHTTTVPGQVAATTFRTGGAEAFEYGSSYYWSCSEYSATDAWFQYWDSSNLGGQYYYNKTNAYRVRAVRRSII